MPMPSLRMYQNPNKNEYPMDWDMYLIVAHAKPAVVSRIRIRMNVLWTGHASLSMPSLRLLYAHGRKHKFKASDWTVLHILVGKRFHGLIDSPVTSPCACLSTSQFNGQGHHHAPQPAHIVITYLTAAHHPPCTNMMSTSPFEGAYFTMACSHRDDT